MMAGGQETERRTSSSVSSSRGELKGVPEAGPNCETRYKSNVANSNGGKH